MDIQAFVNDVLGQNREALPAYFREDAVIRWHCSNEQFTVTEYVKANCDYPGTWEGQIERIEVSGELIVAALCVYPTDRSASFHAVSFLKLRDGLISEMDEYWAADEAAPDWRRELQIGRAIR